MAASTFSLQEAMVETKGFMQTSAYSSNKLTTVYHFRLESVALSLVRFVDHTYRENIE